MSILAFFASGGAYMRVSVHVFLIRVADRAGKGHNQREQRRKCHEVYAKPPIFNFNYVSVWRIIGIYSWLHIQKTVRPLFSVYSIL